MERWANKPLRAEEILKLISPIDIFKRYSDNFQKVGTKFKADFRKDPNPSAIISRYGSTFLYRDFGEDESLNCFQYVSRKYNLDFKETLQLISNDFNLSSSCLITNSGNFIYSTKQFSKQNEVLDYRTIIEIKKRKFNKEDLIWWGDQSWLENMLTAADIKPISHFRLTSAKKNIDHKLYICDDYSYSMDYYWNNGVFRRKLYFPKRESHLKWLSNVDNTVVQGWDLLIKNSEICFITSSFKDTGPFWRIYGKPVAIAPNNEGSFIPNYVFYKLKRRHKQIVLWLDSDDTGIKNMKKFSQIYQIPYIIHNPRLGKDQSEIWKKHGGNVFRSELIKILEEKNINTYL